ncbi:helix-turn-helix domain-containing protein [Mangrovibacterium diazotrophicum]|uniref:Excisionase family DNA binding protein n=1 Tax=Mangrovibacterium diazotrophicum TaxID=1261403 RepID=A0A419W6B4_9BACT|nr:helix-turn-helix domain-containing protein [Mangrovibacterium diazotrophicum]RKD90922.1 excisionase family DNA binding protein [Mangrovibacterium diazotrophicum]
MKNTDTTLLTVEAVADKLSLTNKTVRKHIRSGKIPAQKHGKRWYISTSDFYRIFAEYMTT